MNNFLEVNSWFDKKYKDKLTPRWETIKIALNLFNQNKGKTIVETGTTRMANDWGAGYSTVVFGDYINSYGGKLVTVDIEKANIEFCKSVTGAFKEIEYVVDDSIGYLKNYIGKIDLLYLDSYDYPYGELLNRYGGKEDIDKAIENLKSTPTNELIALHRDLLIPSQEHQLKELELALPHMEQGGIILLDDCDLPGGGKGRLSKEYLSEIGATCILDAYQSLWLL